MSFENSLKNGGIGEHVFWNHYIHMEDVRSIVDVRDDRQFQEYDVDFLVEVRNRQFLWYEVKTDFKAHETGNIVYELSTAGHIGCFEKTKAQYIAYYVVHSEILYIISVKCLRQFVRFPVEPLQKVKMGDHAEGYKLPIADLIKYKVIKQIFEGVK